MNQIVNFAAFRSAHLTLENPPRRPPVSFVTICCRSLPLLSMLVSIANRTLLIFERISVVTSAGEGGSVLVVAEKYVESINMPDYVIPT